jgi:plastocyanin
MTSPLGSAGRWSLAAVVLVAAVGGGGAAIAGATSSTTVVKLQNVAISPKKVTIKRGATVTWKFLDSAIDTEHNVTSRKKSGGLRFRSSTSKQSGTYVVKFTKPGKYFYECTIHPQSMQGEIVVK